MIKNLFGLCLGFTLLSAFFAIGAWATVTGVIPERRNFGLRLVARGGRRLDVPEEYGHG